MSGTYGPLQIPVPAASPAETPGDPLLDVLGEFARAVVNADAGEAWHAVAPSDTQLPVEHVYTFDPRVGGLSEAWLPALFVWRSSMQRSVWLAHDYWIRESEVTMMWVPPRAAKQTDRARRASFLNVIQTVLDAAVDPTARHPAWVVPHDTDPRAATDGSLLWRYLRVWELDATRSEWTTLTLDTDRAGLSMHSVTPVSYPAIVTRMLVRERNVDDVSARMDELDGVEGELRLDGSLPYNAYSYHLSVTGISPATGPTAGGTSVTITGTGFDVGDTPPTVTIGGAIASEVHVAGTGLLTCVTPAGTAGARDVVVANPSGATATLQNGFTYV